MNRERTRRIIVAAVLLIGFLFTAVTAGENTESLTSLTRDGLSSAISSSTVQGEAVQKEEIEVTPNVPDPDVLLQGGDNILTATAIEELPFSDEGTTAGYIDDYDEVCPYASTSPDVVYSYEAPADMSVYITLCNGSAYDTKLFVYENEHTPGDPYACNDDACPGYVSRLNNVFLAAGNTYYIVVDGYGGDYGDYTIDMFELVPCVDCPPGATPEGEPVCYDDYVDETNGGCGSDPVVFGEVSCGETICGTSGTFLYQTLEYRDTDWYNFSLTEDTDITITAMAEFDMQVLIIQQGPDEPCVDYQILYSAVAPICEEYSFQASLTAGDYWIWVAPEEFTGVACGSEYYFTVDCGGQNEVPTLSEWGMILLGLLLVGTVTVAVVRRRQAVSAR
jgi:hypothetical protein